MATATHATAIAAAAAPATTTIYDSNDNNNNRHDDDDDDGEEKKTRTMATIAATPTRGGPRFTHAAAAHLGVLEHTQLLAVVEQVVHLAVRTRRMRRRMRMGRRSRSRSRRVVSSGQPQGCQQTYTNARQQPQQSSNSSNNMTADLAHVNLVERKLREHRGAARELVALAAGDAACSCVWPTGWVTLIEWMGDVVRVVAWVGDTDRR
jgi:hypothetical protein